MTTSSEPLSVLCLAHHRSVIVSSFSILLSCFPSSLFFLMTKWWQLDDSFSLIYIDLKPFCHRIIKIHCLNILNGYFSFHEQPFKQFWGFENGIKYESWIRQSQKTFVLRNYSKNQIITVLYKIQCRFKPNIIGQHFSQI